MKLSSIIENEYAGLEDSDEFESDNGEGYTVWMGGGRWGQHTIYGRYDDLNAALSIAEILSGPISVVQGEVGEEVWNNGVDPMVIESYEGLEDADEFDNTDLYTAEGEVEAMNFMGHTPDSLGIPSELQENGVELTGGYRAMWDHRRNLWVLEESEYAGLEDNDEFDDETYCQNCLGDAEEIARTGDQLFDCQNCGMVYCSSCLPGGGIYNRSIKNGRQFHHAYEVQGGKVGPRVTGRYGNKVPFEEHDFVIENGEVMSCPACYEPGMHPPESITESEYWGLEDQDEFDEGEDLQEAEEVMMWLNNNHVRVEEHDGVVDVVDKHGVLEGLPDGRYFGSDIPADRLVLPSHIGTYVEWFVLRINETMALIWMIDGGSQWHTATIQQLEGGL